MKTLELEKCGMQELHHEEMKEINGGWFLLSWMDSLGLGWGPAVSNGSLGGVDFSKVV